MMIHTVQIVTFQTKLGISGEYPVVEHFKLKKINYLFCPPCEYFLIFVRIK